MKKKPSERRKFAAAIALLIALVAISFFVPAKTGNVTAPMDVSIRNKTVLDIVGLDFKNEISIYDTQNIFGEILNSGATEYDARISITVYNLTSNTSTKMNLVSTYVDSSVHMMPGDRRDFSAIFVPPELGWYYIRFSANYNNRVAETWGSFYVSLTGNELNNTTPPPTNGTNNTGPGNNNTTGPPINIIVTPSNGGVIINKNVFYVPGMVLEYNPSINVSRNETALLGVKVTNTGNMDLTDVTFHISSPDSFAIDIEPKGFQTIRMNESLYFLVSIDPQNATAGEHDLDFAVSSQYVKQLGTVTVDVSELPSSLQDQALRKLLNYEYLITDIEPEILNYKDMGFDTTLPESYLDSGKQHLQAAWSLYDQGKYQEALDELTIVEGSLKEIAFLLGNFTIFVVHAEAFPWWIIILIILIALFLVAVYRREKKKNKRPRLLEKMSEES